MTARCEPPSDAADGSWHWLERDIGSRAAFQWLAAEKNPGWWRPGFFYPPADAHNIGWRYLAPIPSPDAVRALVEAAKDFSVAQATGQCRLSHAIALRKALEPFGGAI